MWIDGRLWSIGNAEYLVYLVCINRLNRQFCGVKSWQNGTRCRDSMKVLWCHSHLVSLAFILKTLCDLFLLLCCLYCCVGIVREKRGGMPSGRKNFEVENFLANFAVLWLFTKVFSAKFVVARQKPEGFLRENRIFHQFAKVFSIESFRYTVELFVYIKHSPLFQMLPSEIVSQTSHFFI